MFLLVTDEYILGTQDCIAVSPRTQDIEFHKFCEDYELATKLNLLSAVLLKPLVSWAVPCSGEQLYKAVATYLSNFKSKADAAEVYELLLTNPIIRILWLIGDTNETNN